MVPSPQPLKQSSTLQASAIRTLVSTVAVGLLGTHCKHSSGKQASLVFLYRRLSSIVGLCNFQFFTKIKIIIISLKRRAISLSAISTALSVLIIPNSKSSCWSKPELLELQNSAGVKALDFRIGDGDLPFDGDQVAIHYYGRLAAKQGWRFDSTYDHKDETAESIPFVFILGSGKVISGIEAAVRSMKVGGIRRVIIPPSQGYQNTSQEPIPPNFSDRQRLFTTIFNPTRLANGEGSTLGTPIFDIELVSLRHR